MIDLFRTGAQLDLLAQGSAKLLAAVIAHSITEAALEPNALEKMYEVNLDDKERDPKTSIWFLFNDRSPFRAYAQLIGVDVHAIREALLNPNITYQAKSPFTAMHARTIRLRYNWYMREQRLLQQPGDTNDVCDQPADARSDLQRFEEANPFLDSRERAAPPVPNPIARERRRKRKDTPAAGG